MSFTIKISSTGVCTPPSPRFAHLATGFIFSLFPKHPAESRENTIASGQAGFVLDLGASEAAAPNTLLILVGVVVGSHAFHSRFGLVRPFVPQRRYHYCHRRPYVVAIPSPSWSTTSFRRDGRGREGESGADVTNILVRALKMLSVWDGKNTCRVEWHCSTTLSMQMQIICQWGN